MARTLVIKGASFSANKVATVVFSSVPCTGIEFSTDTISITGSESVEVSYTVTPADTTDEVVWTSSNTNIVTVSDGVLTVLGVGSCTITATCGEYSDSATVTVEMYAIPNWFLANVSTNASAHVLYWASASATYITAYGKGEQAGQYCIYNAITPSDRNPVIKLPGNTGRIKISVTAASLFYNYDNSKLFWLKDESAQWTQASAAYFDSAETAYNIVTETTKTFNVPTGIDAIVFQTQLRYNQSSVEDAEASVESSGLKIEFLPPEG